MAITLDKILALDLNDYCEMTGKKLADFKPVGVHLGVYVNRQDPTQSIQMFAQHVPDGAEVLVNYKMFNVAGGSAYCEAMYFATGVALIPKPDKQREPLA